MIWNKEMLYKILINISLFKDLFKGSSEILYKYLTFDLYPIKPEMITQIYFVKCQKLCKK